MRESAEKIQVKDLDKVLNVIKNKIYMPQDKQKAAEKKETKQTDKPAGITPDKLPGQMTLDDVQAKAEPKKS